MVRNQTECDRREWFEEAGHSPKNCHGKLASDLQIWRVKVHMDQAFSNYDVANSQRGAVSFLYFGFNGKLYILIVFGNDVCELPQPG